MAIGPLAGATTEPQVMYAARISERRLRVMRDRQGDYRVIESLLLRIQTDTITREPPEPLPLVRLQEGADNVRGLGGDVPPHWVAFVPPFVTLTDSMAQGEVQLAFTYRVPASAPSLVLAAELEVVALTVEIDRGSVRVRPDPALVRDADGGPATRPFRTYVARDVLPDVALSLELVTGSVDGRQRFAVLALTSLLALSAAAWVWRRPEYPR